MIEGLGEVQEQLASTVQQGTCPRELGVNAACIVFPPFTELHHLLNVIENSTNGIPCTTSRPVGILGNVLKAGCLALLTKMDMRLLAMGV